jgi:hypothetical protein
MQFALGIQELPDDDPLIAVIKRLAEGDGKIEEDVLLLEVYARPGPAVRSPRPAANRAGLALPGSSSGISNTWSASRTS